MYSVYALKYIIRCEVKLSVKINFQYLQYFQRRTTVLYLKFDCFERPSSAVWLFLTAIIGSYICIYLNVRGTSLIPDTWCNWNLVYDAVHSMTSLIIPRECDKPDQRLNWFHNEWWWKYWILVSWDQPLLLPPIATMMIFQRNKFLKCLRLI